MPTRLPPTHSNENLLNYLAEVNSRCDSVESRKHELFRVAHLKALPQPTLTDVARVAGVGLATASRVINGGTHVSAGSQMKVEAAIRKLGYLPNHAARILKGGRTKTLGLLMPSLADPFFASCAEAAETVARSHDSLLIVAVSDNDPNLEIEHLAALMRHRPDGLLIVPSNAASPSLRQFVRSSPVPIVSLDRPLPGCPAVLTNSFEAAREATLHLIQHGCRRIICLGAEPNLYTIQERLRGYSQAMKESGLQPRVNMTLKLDGDAVAPFLQAQMEMDSPPDAIFALKNRASIAIFQALQRLKISVPKDVAVIGFDDFDLAETLRPPLTVVRQPVEDIGCRAAELLFAKINRKVGSSSRSAAANVTLPNTLIIRRSCGCKARV